MKHTSKHMKPHAKRCHGVCRPMLLLSLGPSLSGHRTCTGSHAPHAPHTERGRMGSHVLLALHAERVAARASMRCPPNEWLHELPYAAPTLHTPHADRVAATLPCAALQKGPVRAPPYCNCVHHFFLDRHVLAGGGSES
jgi:hypothetical protein